MTRVQCSEVIIVSLMTSCFLLTFDVFHTGSLLFPSIFVHCNLCCPNLHGFPDKYGRVYQKMIPRMKSSILQRDPHANDHVLCEENIFEIRTLPFAFLFA